MRFKKFLWLMMILIPLIPAKGQDTVWSKACKLGEIKTALFNPDETKIIVSGANGVAEFATNDGHKIGDITGIDGIASFSVDKLTAISIDGKKIYNANTYEVIKDFTPLIKNIYYGIFWYSCDNAYNNIAYLYMNGYVDSDTIIFINTKLNTIKKVLSFDKSKGEQYWRIAISPDGKYFATYSYYFGKTDNNPNDDCNIVRLWSMETFEVIKEIKRNSGQFSNWPILFSPDSKLLAVYGDSGIQVYEIPSGILKYNTSLGGYNFSFSEDSKCLYTSYYTFLKYSLEQNKALYEIKYPLPWGFITPANEKHLSISGGNGRMFLINEDRVGIIDNSNHTPIIYPNPTSGLIVFEPSFFKQGNLKLVITDLIGNTLKTLFNDVYNLEKLQFEIYFLPTGTYYLNATQNDLTQTYKLIKE